MREWFEFMDQHKNPQKHNNKFIEINLFEETNFLRTWIDSEKWTIKSNKPPFTVDNYVMSLSDEYLNYLQIDRDTVKQWINDPKYHKLMNISGVQTDILIPEFIHNSLIENIGCKLPVKWQTANINLFVQNPGDMFPLHYDRFKSYDYDLSLNQENRIKRWLIMLYDQQPGQCFFMNNESLTWRAGDVVDWEQTNYHHGTANFGYYPRFSLRITGELIKE